MESESVWVWVRWSISLAVTVGIAFSNPDFRRQVIGLYRNIVSRLAASNGHAYFPPRYFAPRYFGQLGGMPRPPAQAV